MSSAIWCDVAGSTGDLGNTGSFPGLGRSQKEDRQPIQHCCLGNPMDGGAWWATAQGAEKSGTTGHTHQAHGELWVVGIIADGEGLGWRDHQFLRTSSSLHSWHSIRERSLLWWLPGQNRRPQTYQVACGPSSSWLRHLVPLIYCSEYQNAFYIFMQA